MAFELAFPGATDPDGIYAEFAAALLAELPTLDLAAVDLEAAIGRAVAQVASTTRRLLVDRILADYRRLGQTLYELAPQTAVAATAPTTWTIRDTGAPVVIPAGTRLAWPSAAGDVAFELVEQISVDAGTTIVADVTIVAGTAGTAPHTLAVGPLRLSDPLGVVIAIVATAPPTGGADDETARDYDVRLRDRIQLFGESYVVAADYRIAVLQDPRVGRALALPGYDPDTDTHDNVKTVTVAMADVDGAPILPAVRDEIAAGFADDSVRVVNWITATIDPTYTPLAIAAAVTVEDGYDAATVLAEAQARGYAFVSPATWPWAATVIRDEIYYQIRDTRGVASVPVLTLNGDTADVPLAGVAPLPAPASDPDTPTTVQVILA